MVLPAGVAIISPEQDCNPIGGGGSKEELRALLADNLAAGSEGRGGRAVRIGLVDPGARGDVSLISRNGGESGDDRGSDRRRSVRLAQTGFQTCLLALIGAGMLGLGAAGRRLERHAAGAAHD